MVEKLKLVVGEGIEGEQTIVDKNSSQSLIKIKNAIENMEKGQTLRITKEIR